MLIPVNNFLLQILCLIWMRRKKQMQLEAESWSQTVLLWAVVAGVNPLKDADLWQYNRDVLLRILRCYLVVTVRIKGFCIHFFSLGGHKPVCCCSDEKNVAHSSSLPVFHRNASRPVYSRAWLDFSWLIGLEHQPFWRILKCRGRVVPSCWCLSSPPVMGRRTHLQAEGICPVGAGRLSVSSETRCAWQPLPRLKARTYSL